MGLYFDDLRNFYLAVAWDGGRQGRSCLPKSKLLPSPEAGSLLEKRLPSATDEQGQLEKAMIFFEVCV